VARTEDPFQRRRLLAGDESGGLQRRKGVERLAGRSSTRNPEGEGRGGGRGRGRGEHWWSTLFAMLLKLSSSSLLSAPNSYLARVVGIIDHKSTIGNAPLSAAGRAPLGLSKPRSSLPMEADARVPRVCIAFASKICSARAAATVCRWDGLISAFWSSPETRIFASFALILRASRRANERAVAPRSTLESLANVQLIRGLCSRELPRIRYSHLHPFPEAKRREGKIQSDTSDSIALPLENGDP
jgi:hypothetical protein